MAQQTIEERVSKLESEVSRLRLEVAREKGAVIGRTAPDFLDKFTGIFANDPAFEEVTAEIEARRERERHEAEREADTATNGVAVFLK